MEHDIMTLSNVFHGIWMLWDGLWKSGLGLGLLGMFMTLCGGICFVIVIILLITGKDPGDMRIPRPLWVAALLYIAMIGEGITLYHQGHQLMAAW